MFKINNSGRDFFQEKKQFLDKGALTWLENQKLENQQSTNHN